MNYQHSYHAGNHADVLKHSLLIALLEALKSKPSPFFVLDTHAGAGMYDLSEDNSQTTMEFQSGIAKLWDLKGLPSVLGQYVEAVRRFNPDQTLHSYPGSPALIADYLRAGDLFAACEIVAEQARPLRRLFATNPQVSVHQRDGYQAVRALLPPKNGSIRLNRGLVLIDPPYESQMAEFDSILEACQDGLIKFPQATFMIWYPIKIGRELNPIFRRFSQLDAKSILRAELLIRADDSPLRLNGSGCIILNAPWKIEESIKPALDILKRFLSESSGSVRLDFIKTAA